MNTDGWGSKMIESAFVRVHLRFNFLCFIREKLFHSRFMCDTLPPFRERPRVSSEELAGKV